MAKTRKQLADEAYHRDEARRAKSLQLDIEQTIMPDDPGAQPFSRAPLVCPACNRDMHDAFGGAWAPMTPISTELRKLQCGYCGGIIVVADNVWKAVRDERYQKVGISDVKPPKPEPRDRRTRGAG